MKLDDLKMDLLRVLGVPIDGVCKVHIEYDATSSIKVDVLREVIQGSKFRYHSHQYNVETKEC